MKYILVIDLQSGCLGCPCYRQTYVDDWEMNRATCEAMLRPLNYNEIVAKRPTWCPLKPLPEKLIPEMVMGNKYAMGCVNGWNDCLKEICDENMG